MSPLRNSSLGVTWSFLMSLSPPLILDLSVIIHKAYSPSHFMTYNKQQLCVCGSRRACIFCCLLTKWLFNRHLNVPREYTVLIVIQTHRPSCPCHVASMLSVSILYVCMCVCVCVCVWILNCVFQVSLRSLKFVRDLQEIQPRAETLIEAEYFFTTSESQPHISDKRLISYIAFCRGNELAN
jgi:hypothetical protein